MSNSISSINKRQRLRKIFLSVAAVCVIAGGGTFAYLNTGTQVERNFSQLSQDVDAGTVKKLSIPSALDGGNARVELANGKQYNVAMPATSFGAASDFAKKGVEVEF